MKTSSVKSHPLVDDEAPLTRKDQVIWVAFQEPEIPLI